MGDVKFVLCLLLIKLLEHLGSNNQIKLEITPGHYITKYAFHNHFSQTCLMPLKCFEVFP